MVADTLLTFSEAELLDRLLMIAFAFAFAFALALGTWSTAVAQDQVQVSTCPTPISLQLQGVWADARPNGEAKERLQGNPARRADVVAVFAKADGASLTVEGLASLKAVQGRIGRTEFQKIRDAFRVGAAARLEAIRDRIKFLADAGGYSVDRASIAGLVDVAEDRFYVPGTTAGISADGVPYEFISAMVMQHKSGCAITAIVALPASDYRFGDLDQAVAGILVR